MGDIGEQLRAVWLSEPPRLDGPVHLAESDPTWPAHFEREAKRIREALGRQALAVEHVAYTQEYADAKGEVVEQILARAGAPSRNDQEVERPAAATPDSGGG